MQSLVPEQKSALAYLWVLASRWNPAPQWALALLKAVPLYFFACSNAILDASRIPIEENVAPLTVSIPSVLCFSSILGCMDLHALLKKLLVSEFVLVTSVIFPSLIVSVMLTFPEYPIADPV